jgi:hypothetical protein
VVGAGGHGTNTDYAVLVGPGEGAAGDFFEIYGDGGITLGPSSIADNGYGTLNIGSATVANPFSVATSASASYVAAGTFTLSGLAGGQEGQVIVNRDSSSKDGVGYDFHYAGASSNSNHGLCLQGVGDYWRFFVDGGLTVSGTGGIADPGVGAIAVSATIATGGYAIASLPTCNSGKKAQQPT